MKGHMWAICKCGRYKEETAMRAKVKYKKKRAKRASNNEHLGRAMWANQSKPCGQRR